MPFFCDMQNNFCNILRRPHFSYAGKRDSCGTDSVGKKPNPSYIKVQSNILSLVHKLLGFFWVQRRIPDLPSVIEMADQGFGEKKKMIQLDRA